MIDGAATCPICNGPVDSMLDCHTWPQTQQDGTVRWMSCLPCDSATYWYCEGTDDRDGCGWNWTQGLNPRNPRAATNDARRPSWADPSQRED